MRNPQGRVIVCDPGSSSRQGLEIASEPLQASAAILPRNVDVESRKQVSR